MAVTAKHILKMIADKFDLRRECFSDRIRLQKIIYLLQSYGMKLGYGFGWYRNGPYSQDLVYDAYTVLKSESETYATQVRELRLSEEAESRLNRFRDTLGDAFADPRKLELAASVDFLRRTWYPDATPGDIYDRLQEHKAQLHDGSSFSRKDVDEALALLDQLACRLN